MLAQVQLNPVHNALSPTIPSSTRSTHWLAAQAHWLAAQDGLPYPPKRDGPLYSNMLSHECGRYPTLQNQQDQDAAPSALCAWPCAVQLLPLVGRQAAAKVTSALLKADNVLQAVHHSCSSQHSQLFIHIACTTHYARAAHFRLHSPWVPTVSNYHYPTLLLNTHVMTVLAKSSNHPITALPRVPAGYHEGMDACNMPTMFSTPPTVNVQSEQPISGSEMASAFRLSLQDIDIAPYIHRIPAALNHCHDHRVSVSESNIL